MLSTWGVKPGLNTVAAPVLGIDGTLSAILRSSGFSLHRRHEDSGHPLLKRENTFTAIGRYDRLTNNFVRHYLKEENMPANLILKELSRYKIGTYADIIYRNALLGPIKRYSYTGHNGSLSPSSTTG